MEPNSPYGIFFRPVEVTPTSPFEAILNWKGTDTYLYLNKKKYDDSRDKWDHEEAKEILKIEQKKHLEKS